MKLTLATVLAASLGLVASLATPSARDGPVPPAGSITAPSAYQPIAPGALFNFSYNPSADYCRSTYAYSVWLITQAPATFTPADVFAGGWFFGRYDYPNVCRDAAVPYAHNEAPPQTLVNETLQLAVIEEWDGCGQVDGPPGMRISLTTVPIVYNATTSA